jgi:hypothetical protein
MLVIKDYIKVVNIDDLLRIILKVKGIEFNVSLSDAQLNLILDFYYYGINDVAYKNHLDKSLRLANYYKSKATIDNNKSYLKKMKVLVKDTKGDLIISPLYLPLNLGGKILLNLNILHDK